MTLQRYLLRQFFVTFLLCLFGTTSLFLLFDFFDRMRTFTSKETPAPLIIEFMLLQVPFMVHLMIPN